MDPSPMDSEDQDQGAALEHALVSLRTISASAISMHATMSADLERLSAEKSDLAALRDQAREISDLVRDDHARVDELVAVYGERLSHFGAAINEIRRLMEQIEADLGKARAIGPSQN